MMLEMNLETWAGILEEQTSSYYLRMMTAVPVLTIVVQPSFDST